jgi:uncharacterized membrane protein YqgA involved in biofilm formation
MFEKLGAKPWPTQTTIVISTKIVKGILIMGISCSIMHNKKFMVRNFSVAYY